MSPVTCQVAVNFLDYLAAITAISFHIGMKEHNFDIDCLKAVFVFLHYCNKILRSYASILQHNTPQERVMLHKLPSVKVALYCIAYFQPKRSESIGINAVFLSISCHIGLSAIKRCFVDF
jgi:hypothetical protein